jgi:hypothetical protein
MMMPHAIMSEAVNREKLPAVSPEFTGMARSFLIEAEKSFLSLKAELEPIRYEMAKRLARRTQIRGEHIDEFERILNTPRFCSLSRHPLNRDRGSRKLRGFCGLVGKTQAWKQSWTSKEVVAELGVLWVDIRPHKMLITPTSVASVSLHALSRRMQRGFSTDREAVVDDLRTIVLQADAVYETLYHRVSQPDFVQREPTIDWQFAIKCRDGAWFGHVHNNRHSDKDETTNVELAVRTFYSNDEAEAKQIAITVR